MMIRPVTENDAEAFYHMLCLLDEETDFMMYEPGERKKKTRDLSFLREKIKAAISGEDLLLAAVNDEKSLIGYIWAERGKLNRILHTAYIVVGIRKAYRRQGIGTEFFHRLDAWARAKGVIRLELTVEVANTGAKKLYEKNGFKVEGLRVKSMNVKGQFMDEYYMGKIIP